MTAHRVARVALALALLAPPAAPGADPDPAVAADVTCRPADTAATYACRITLTDPRTGHRIEEAAVVLGAARGDGDGPAQVPEARAEPGVEPGVYEARLGLPAPGRWRLRIRVTRPVRAVLERGLYVHPRPADG